MWDCSSFFFFFFFVFVWLFVLLLQAQKVGQALQKWDSWQVCNIAENQHNLGKFGENQKAFHDSPILAHTKVSVYLTGFRNAQFRSVTLRKSISWNLAPEEKIILFPPEGKYRVGRGVVGWFGVWEIILKSGGLQQCVVC